VPKQARSRARVEAAISEVVRMIGEEPDRDITTADVAARIGIPVGSLYEYFEDVPSIVDAAVARMLDRHDELLRVATSSSVSSVHELIDVMFDAYLRLYTEQPAFVLVRNSSYWNEHHRRWLIDRVEVFLADVVTSMLRAESSSEDPALGRRLALIFAAGDAMLQRILRDGLEPDPVLASDARTTVKFMFDLVTNPVS
jgi:AcrR family transcriptional regulator